MKRLLPYILLSCSLCIISFFAYANAKPDAEMPVQIQSDQVNFDQKSGIATYTGHVVVEQGSRLLYADKLVIHRGQNNKINLMVATGKPAKFKAHDNKNKPPGSGNAKMIKYYPQLNKVDLLGNATLTQDEDTISGSKLTYNFVTEELQSNSNQQQRTTVILQPKRVP